MSSGLRPSTYVISFVTQSRRTNACLESSVLCYAFEIHVSSESPHRMTVHVARACLVTLYAR